MTKAIFPHAAADNQGKQLRAGQRLWAELLEAFPRPFLSREIVYSEENSQDRTGFLEPIIADNDRITKGISYR